MIREQFPGIEALSDYDKAILLEELLSYFEEKVRPEPDPEIIALLRERWEHYLAHPETAVSWEEVKRKMAEQRKPVCSK
jgi:hypothetical protein